MTFLQSILNAISRFFAWIFGSREVDPENPAPPKVSAPWYKLALQERGTLEGEGEKNNPVVLQYYKDAGFPEIDADSVSWCGAYIGAMLERAGYASAKSLVARDYLNWGKKLTKPKQGCIAVFWRSSPRSWQGHVGFFVKEDSTHVWVLGGNQSNAVNISKYPKARLLGYRWPVTGANSRTYRASAAGIVTAGATATAILESQTELVTIAKQFDDIAPQVAMIGPLAMIAVCLITVWARYSDNKDKGR